ncbi:barrier-to-autointegration factor-like [Drosophila albomicans]|uniref:Barrier-to-autointegration factor-like n=1 Tax=Drosophila albomicans TaxID=7291 RepID=A0A6P8WI44_DROAB|nr:barrier-to-autointegration factor-like [Drosophila albomicans]
MNRDYPSTSQKQRDFMEPMGDKLVTRLPGIGETLGDRMTNAGYQKASQVLGQYLAVDQNRQEFGHFMKDTCNANTKQSSDCYNGLKEWTREFL